MPVIFETGEPPQGRKQQQQGRDENPGGLQPGE